MYGRGLIEKDVYYRELRLEMYTITTGNRVKIKENKQIDSFSQGRSIMKTNTKEYKGRLLSADLFVLSRLFGDE